MIQVNGRYLLDTNIVIDVFENTASSKEIRTTLGKAVEVSVSTISLGELYFGAQKSRRCEENIREIEKIAVRYTVFDVDKETSELYGIIKAGLKAKGRPIPENDMWIAAIAMQHQLNVVTHDKHFRNIDNLEVTFVATDYIGK